MFRYYNEDDVTSKEQPEKPDPELEVEYEQKNHFFAYLSLITITILGFTFGLHNSWPSPMLIKLLTGDSPIGHPITKDEASWVASLSNFGAIFAPLPLGYAANRFGRRPVLITVGAILSLAAAIMSLAPIVEAHYFARFLVGVGTGASIPTLGMYLLETWSYKDKSLLMGSVLTTVMFGMLVSYLVGPFVSYGWFNFFCLGFPVTFCLVFGFTMPDTPGFLLMKGRREEALETLQKFRKIPSEGIAKEIRELEKYIKENENLGSIFDLIRDKVLLKCFAISLVMQTAQSLSGAIPLGAYKQLIFEEAHTNLSSEFSSIIVATVQFILTFPTPFVLKKFKYRTLLVFSSLGMALSLMIMGLYFHLSHATDTDTSTYGWVPIVTMITALFAYMCGVAIIPGMMIVEFYPLHVRALALALTSSITSVETFLVTKYFLAYSDLVGTAWCFWSFAISCVVASVVYLLIVPETNGKTYQEVQDMLRKKKTVTIAA